MYETLINLYNGNLNLSKRLTSFPVQMHYEKEYRKLKNQLDSLLDEDGKKLLDKLLDVSNLESGYSSYDSFITGYRLATLLMVEVFQDKDKLLENREQYLRNLIHRPYHGTPSAADDFANN